MKQTQKKNTAALLLTPIVAGIFALMLSGCSTADMSESGQDSNANVQLTQGNYTVVKANAKGTSRGFKLLGLIPFNRASYADAKEDLYKSAGEDMTGRSIALTNQSEDKSSFYIILYSVPKITLSADIIEFDTPAPAQPAAIQTVEVQPAVAPVAVPAATTNAVETPEPTPAP